MIMKLTLMAFIAGLCAGILLQKAFARDVSMKTASSNHLSDGLSTHRNKSLTLSFEQNQNN